MHLNKLVIRNFRCVENAVMQPGPGLNLIIGDNTSGKTSILESIYFLGRVRSFRHNGGDALIREGQQELTVFGRVQREHGSVQTFGVRRQRRETTWKIDQRTDASLLELVKQLPIQVIDPNLHQLLEEGPAHRRRFLDWGVFHVEHDFYPAWRRFQRTLKQRNRSLKTAANTTLIRAWDSDLSAYASRVDDLRRRYLTALDEILSDFVRRVLPDTLVEVQYYAGWQRNQDYVAVLEAGLSRDRALGYTQAGPHRADLRIKIDGDPVRQRASRGQQKLITMVLLLAQAELIRRRRGEAPIVLIDDLAAELGAGYRRALFDLVASLGSQCFVTFLSAEDVPLDGRSLPMFHVEHGRLSPVI